MHVTAAVRYLFIVACAVAADTSSVGPPLQPASSGESEWSKLEHLHEYPSAFRPGFADSLCAKKKFSFARNLRTADSIPFVKGEKFVYDVGWGPLRAGYVILETAPDPATGLLVVTGRGMTNNFFSAFYKVRDFVQTILDPHGIYPFFFEQHLREGRYKDDRWELFDQAGRKAYTYQNDTGAVECPALVQNFFSLVMYVRSLSFAPGDSLFADCFVHKKSFRIVLHCLEGKPIAVDAGTFNCLLVKPILVGEGRVFTKRDEIHLWLTNDDYKMPVLVSAKIAVGSITARLIWYERKADQE